MVITHIIILLTLLGINGFFSASEVTILSLKPTAKVRLSKKGYSGKCLQLLLNDSGQFFATVQLGITFAGFLASAFAADTFSDLISESLHKGGFTFIDAKTLDSMIVVLITVLMSYITTVIGELFPKRIGIQYSEQLASKIAIPIVILMKTAAPFVWLLNNSVAVLVKIAGLSDNHLPEISKEEIRQYVELGCTNGVISTTEKEITNKIFELGECQVSSLMIKREDCPPQSLNITSIEIDNLISQKYFPYIPIYEHDTNNIVGVFDTKEYLITRLSTPDLEIKTLLKRLYCADDCVNIATILEEMKIQGTNVIILKDKSGSYTGIISNEQIIHNLNS